MKTNEQELKGAFPLVHENGDLTESGKKFIKQFTAYKTAAIVSGAILGGITIAFGIAVLRRIRASRNSGVVVV
jgi:hypothetical protein